MRSISELRAALGWSQDRLAQVLGCTQPTVDRLEGGQAIQGATARLAARLDHLLDAAEISPAMPVAEVISILVRGLPDRDLDVLPEAFLSIPEPESA